MSDEEIQLNLKWDNFSSHLALSFDSCYESQQFVDVSLVCKDGEVIKGHKMILANTSKFFRRLLTENEHPHPMIVLHTIDADDLRSLMTFMYCGEVQVFQNDLKKLLEIADILEITGLQQIQELDNPGIRFGVKNFATLNRDFDQSENAKNDADGGIIPGRSSKPASNLLKYVSSLGQKNLDNSLQSFESSSKKLQEMARKFEKCSNVGSWSFMQHASISNEAKIKEITNECSLKTLQKLPEGEPETGLDGKSSSRKLQEMAKLLENINRNPAMSEVSKGTSDGHKRSLDSEEITESPAKKPNLNRSTANTSEAEPEVETMGLSTARDTNPGRSITDEPHIENCSVFIKDEFEVNTECSTTPDVDLDNLQTDHLNVTNNGEHSGTSMLAAELLKAVANKRKETWMSYIDRKIADLEAKICSDIKSSRRSILYELEKKINDVKNMIIIATGGEARVENISSARDKLGISLPITSLEEYLAFEDQISTDQEKKQSLKALFAVLIAGSTSWKDDVGKLMNAVISKAVQLHFSGCGRKVRGEGKRNFSGTTVFECIRDLHKCELKNIDSDDPDDPSDSEYMPQEKHTSDSASDVENAIDETENRSEEKYSPNNSHEISHGLTISTAKTLQGSNRCNDDDLHVEKSTANNGDMKQNFCLYCNKKQKKIARHLETKHGNEPEVKKFVDLPKNCPERRKIIGVIRKKGNFLFNTQTEYNDGELIVSRRPNAKYNRSAHHFRACANCKGFFSKNSLRMHFAKCTGRSSKKNREVMVMSKQVMARIHSRASETTINLIFPPLREDEVVRAIRYDELVILYANKMGGEYQRTRDYQTIRQRIRLLGRFLLTIKKLNNEITDLTSVYDPKFCDDAVKAIIIEASLMRSTPKTPTPAVASSLGTLLKVIGSILVNECIKKHDDIKKKHTKDFVKLLTEELSLKVKRRVTELQTLQKQEIKVELPSMDNVRKLYTYLEQERNEAFQELTNNFSEQAWLKLAEATLTSTQLFNRRQAGEIERTLIEDFKNYQSLDVDTDKELFSSLSKENQALAKKYVRFVIMGELNRTVPVVLSTQLSQCIELLITHRKDMNISSNNPYVFGLPGRLKSNYEHLNACVLMRRFSTECGATNPERLQGDGPCKHIATVCVSLNLSDHQVTDLTNFTGHADKIHEEIYGQPLVNREILGMSKLLEVAQGADGEIDDGDANGTDDEEQQLEYDDDDETDNTESFPGNNIETTTRQIVPEISKHQRIKSWGTRQKHYGFQLIGSSEVDPLE